MAIKTYPVFGGGGGGGGPAVITFPIKAPPGAAGNEPYGFTTGGGLHGTPSGGVVLSVAQGGDALSLDNQGNASLAQMLQVAGLATLAGGVTSPSGTLGTLSVQQNAQVGGNLGVTGSVQVTADLSARKITASSDLSAASISTQGNIAGTSLTITGTATLGGLNVQGTFHASNIQSDGNFYFPTTGSSAPGLALADEHGTGIFGAPGTLGISVAGSTALSFGASLKANFAGDLAAGQGTFQGLQTTQLNASGTTTLQTVSAQQLTAAGPVQLGTTTVQGDLTVQGATRLANLIIDQLSTDHDLSVGGNASVQGTTALGGALTVNSSGSFQSLTTGGLTASGTTYLQRVRQPGSSDQNPYVDNDVSPGGRIIPFTVLIAPEGILKIAGSFTALGSGSFGGAVSMGNLTAGSGTFSGGGSFGGGGTFQGPISGTALSVTGGVTALFSKVGGSTFQTCHGTPNGQVTGSVGDLVIDLDAGQAYLKQSGTASNTGWVEVTTQANATGFPLLAPDTQPSAVPFSFASDGGTGMGRNAQNPLYFAVSGSIAVVLGASGAATFNAAVTAKTTLTVQGALSAQSSLAVGAGLTVSGNTGLQGLTAGTTQVGALTASQAVISGTLQAQATTLSQLTVSGASNLNGALTVVGATQVAGLSASGAVTSAVSLAAPKLLAGTSTIQSGSGSPNGQVAGSIGDLYIENDTAYLWQKTDSSANSGWLKIGGGGAGSFPLAAPLSANFAAPSYGFAGTQMGVTDNGANVLVGVTSGQVGWTLDASGNFSLRGGLTATGGPAQLAAISSTSVTATGAGQFGGNLSVTGSATVGALTAAATQVQSLTTTTGSVNSAQNVSAAASVSGALVVSNGSTWRAGSGAPLSAVGQPGDLASATGQNPPFYVRTQSAWRAVALVGDAAPSQFPLNGPADSAAAPNYSTSLSPNTGMYFPAANQIGWSTNGVRAGSVDANQNWSLVGNLAAAAATFTGLTVNGTASVTGAVQLSSTLGVTGNVTLAANLNAANIVASSSLQAASATINGALGAQTITTTSDVTVGGNLQVSGTTTYNGINRAGYYQVGDGTVSSPAYAFTSEPGLGWWRASAGVLAAAVGGANTVTLAANLATFAGGVRVGNTNAGLVSPGANQLALQTAGTTALSIGAGGISTFAFQAQHVAGTAAAPGVAVGTAAQGLYGGTDGFGQGIVAVSTAGLPVANFVNATLGGAVTYQLRLGDPSSTTVRGGLTASAQTPVGNVNGLGGSVYQWLGGGPAQSLWVHEGTGAANSSGWAKVLTTSSSVVPTYPLQVPAGSSASPQVASANAAGSGLFFAGGTAYAPAFAQGGVGIAQWQSFSLGGNPSYGMFYGPSGTSGGIISCASAPNPNYAGSPAMLYQQPGGGAGASLWVCEATTGTSTSAWAKVLTSSSTITPTFPLQATVLGSYTSGSPPAYTFAQSGYGTTGMYAAAEQSTGNPVVAFASNGLPVGYFQGQTISTKPVYNLWLGDPVTSNTAGGSGIRVSPQSPVNTIGAFQGQLFLNSAGGIGTSVYVKETYTSTNATLGWSYLFTSGMAQLAAQNGTVAAPYYSFPASLSTGLTYVSDQGSGGLPAPAMVSAGKVCAYFDYTTVNSLPVYNVIIGDPTVASAPYPGAIRVSAQPASNIIGAVGQLAINPAGGPGTVLAVKESGVGSTSGWAFVLTATSSVNSFSFNQVSSITNVSGKTLLWADPNTLVRVGLFGVNSTTAPTLKQEIVATPYGASQTILRDNNNTTICLTAATQYTLTLPASSTAIDLCYRFQVESSAGVIIQAATGQLIYIGSAVTSATGGTIRTTTVGATIELFCRAGTNNWYARGPCGTWVVS